MQKLCPESALAQQHSPRAGGLVAAAGARGTGPLLRLNNVAGVTESEKTSTDPELLYCGADYLILNVLPVRHWTDTPSLKNLALLFGKEKQEIEWEQTGIKLITESFERKGIRTIYLTLGRHKLFAVEEIDEKSNLKKNLRYRYDYRFSFYSAFFCNVRLGLLRQEDFLGVFLDDIQRNHLVHAVSRLDVCADVRNMTTVEVFHGIQILSPDKAKKFSFISADKALTSVETIYQGSPRDPESHNRIYNKLLEIVKEDKKRNRPSKEDLFPDYFDYPPPITRIEVQMNGSCRTYEIDLPKALDLEVQLGLFLKHIDGKYSKWDIAEFVRRSMRDRGFGPWDVKRKTLTSERISNMQAIWLYRSRGKNLAERCGISVEELNTICARLPIKQPSDAVKYAGC